MLHKLSKYRGQDGEAPKLNKLGSGAWNRIKERTKSRLKDIARDLIRLYAARKNQQGHAFAPDSYMQNELEASFVYEDTPDQLDHLLRMSVDIGTQQTGKTAYAVVHVHYVVAGLYCAQFLE